MAYTLNLGGGNFAYMEPERYAVDDLELDSDGQLRIGSDGEQRALPGLGSGPAPAPTEDLQHTADETAPPTYRCASCGRHRPAARMVYSRFTGNRHCINHDEES